MRRWFSRKKEEHEFTPDTRSHLGDITKTMEFYAYHTRVMGSSHYAQAREMKRYNIALTISLIGLGVLVTIFPIIISRWDPKGESFYLWAIATFLGAGALALAAIQYYISWDARAGAHELAAGEYSRIRREIEVFLCKTEDNQASRFTEFQYLIKLCVLCSSMCPAVERKHILFYQKKYRVKAATQAEESIQP